MRRRGPFNVFCSTAGFALLPCLCLYIESLIPPSFYLLIQFYLFFFFRLKSQGTGSGGKGLFGWHAASRGVQCGRRGNNRRGRKVRRHFKELFGKLLDIWSCIPSIQRRLGKHAFVVRIANWTSSTPTHTPKPRLLSRRVLGYQDESLCSLFLVRLYFLLPVLRLLIVTNRR